ncbi:MAG: pyruvate carboxylase subunit B [Caldimonas sp.]
MSRLGFIDVTLRDGHQCLWATRMTTAMMTPILSTIDRAGYDYVNILGGAVFDVCVRYLHENPWRRIQTLCSGLKTPADGFLRGQSLYTFELFPDDIVELNSKVLARNGLKNVTVYDAINDNRNVEVPIASAHAAGMTVTAVTVYTLSPVHTDAYYVERIGELLALGADRVGVKDPTGLLTPERAKTLFPAVMAAAKGTAVELHSHCQSSLAPEVYSEAIRAGFHYVHTAVSPLANGASLPAVEDIAARAAALGVETSLDLEAIAEVAGYFDWLCVREGKPRGCVVDYEPSLYSHQVPGGMISNLKSQLQTMNMAHRLAEILEEVGRVREDLGYPILVSPFAQFVVTQAVINVMQGERYRTIPDEVRKYAMGYYGRLAATPSAEFLERAGVEPGVLAAERAGTHVEPWVPRLRRALGPGADDEDVLLAAFYDKALLAPLRGQPPARYEYATTPLAELVAYVRRKPDLGQRRVRVGRNELVAEPAEAA